DPYGNVRLAELELSRLLKERVSGSLKGRGVPVSIVAKDIGYELRCAPPGGFDIHYCRGLGYWATRFLAEGGTDAMVTMQGDTFVPVPFRDLIDAKNGRFRVRHVDVESAAYQMLAAYMIRLTRADLDDPEQVSALAHAGALDEATLVKRFGDVVAPGRAAPCLRPGHGVNRQPSPSWAPPGPRSVTRGDVASRRGSSKREARDAALSQRRRARAHRTSRNRGVPRADSDPDRLERRIQPAAADA